MARENRNSLSVTREEIAAPFHNTVLIDPQAELGANMGIIFKVTVPTLEGVNVLAMAGRRTRGPDVKYTAAW